MEKIIIYQVFTRLFGNRNLTRKAWGTVAENGCGKFADIDESVLKQLKLLGAMLPRQTTLHPEFPSNTQK